MPNKSVLLLHGAWHGGWCWNYLVPHLRLKSIKVLAPNLPGRSGVSEKTLSPSGYLKFIIQLIHSSPEPVFIVAHSLAGIFASQLIESIPKKISGIAYVSAFLLRDGQSVFDVITDNPSLITQSLVISDSHINILPKVARQALYNYCVPEIATWASNKLCPEPVEPMQTPIHFCEKKFSQVKTYYVLCTEDMATLPDFQRKMCQKFPDTQIIEFKSDHSPFLCRPKDFADLVNMLATI